MSRTLPRLKREGGISLEIPQRKRASSRVKGRISWFFLSCGWKLGVPLELRWGPQGTTHVPSGKSSLHTSCKRPLRIPLQSVPGPSLHLKLRPEPQGSAPGPTWISGFLWGIHRGVRASSRVEPCKSPLHSSQKSSVRLPVVLTIRISGFLSRRHSAITPALVF